MIVRPLILCFQPGLVEHGGRIGEFDHAVEVSNNFRRTRASALSTSAAHGRWTRQSQLSLSVRPAYDVRSGGDLMFEHVPGPAARGRLRGVPVSVFVFVVVVVVVVVVVEPVEEDSDVTSVQLSNSLLDNCLRRPLPRETAHVEQLRPRRPLHFWKLCAQVRRATTDDVAPHPSSPSRCTIVAPF
jgi:hypothetical protein